MQRFMDLNFDLDICKNYLRFDEKGKVVEVFVKNLFDLYWNKSKINFTNIGKSFASRLHKYKMRGVEFHDTDTNLFNKFVNCLNIDTKKLYEIGEANFINCEINLLNNSDFPSLESFVDECQRIRRRFKKYKIHSRFLSKDKFLEFQDCQKTFTMISELNDSTFVTGVDTKKLHCLRNDCIAHVLGIPHLHFIYDGKNGGFNQIFIIK
jgi:hypothetical protein